MSASSSPPPQEKQLEEEKMITLRSNDGQEFVLKESVAIKANTIKNLIDSNCSDSIVPLSNVEGTILSKITHYMYNNNSQSHEVSDESLNKKNYFDQEFVKEMSFDDMFELMLAANYLDIRDLLDLLCKIVAKRIEDKSPEEIREIFQVENDYTEEEERALREENSWAFETNS